MDSLDNFSNFIFYTSENGNVQVQVVVDSKTETIWASQKAMGDIFDVEPNTINYHLAEIFK